MRNVSRRRFIRDSAGAVAAMGALPLSTASFRDAEAAAIGAAATPDAVAVKQLVSGIAGTVISIIVPFYSAVTRIDPKATAFPLRNFGYELDMMGRWSDPADGARATQWVRTLRDALQPLANGSYVNQLGETSQELVRAAYGNNYARLSAVKKQFDPQNALRSHQNVEPA